MGTTLGDLLSSNAYSGGLLDPTSDGLELWDDSEPSGDQSKGITVDQLHRLHPESPMEDEANTFTEPQEINTGSAEAPLELGTDQKEEKVDGLEADLLDNRHDVGFDLNVDDLAALKALEKTDALSFLRTPAARSGPFIAKDADPFGDGADDAMAVETQNGNWWARQKAVAHDPIRARWFGFHPSATALENADALQKAINRAAQVGAIEVILPWGTFEINGPIYLTHDSNDNPEYPNNSSADQGNLQIVGAGVPNIPSLTDESNADRGTILRFRNATGSCFEGIETGFVDAMRGMRFRNFGMSAETEDQAIKVQGAGQFAGFDRVRIHVKDGNADGVIWQDVVTSSINNLWVSNRGASSSSGTGLLLSNPSIGGAGLLDITQSTFGQFKTGVQMGESATAGISGVAFYSCQLNGNETGLLCKFGNGKAHNMWYESNTKYDVRVAWNATFSDIGGKTSSIVSEANFLFGDDSLSDPVDSVGQGNLINTRINGVENFGVRVEGGTKTSGVTAVGVRQGPNTDGVGYAYGISDPNLRLSVVAPRDTDFGDSFNAYYQNPSYHSIIDGQRGIYSMPNIPTSQPSSSNQLWSDGGTIKIS